jgi:hypothetical protein
MRARPLAASGALESSNSHDKKKKRKRLHLLLWLGVVGTAAAALSSYVADVMAPNKALHFHWADASYSDSSGAPASTNAKDKDTVSNTTSSPWLPPTTITSTQSPASNIEKEMTLDEGFSASSNSTEMDWINNTEIDWILPKGMVAKKIQGHVTPRSFPQGLEFGPCAMAVVEPFDSHQFLLAPPKKERWLATIAAGVRNEGPYIVEFINHHILLGFEHFVFCDDKSVDNTVRLLQPYVDARMVTLLYGMDQWQCHKEASLLLHNKTEWIYGADMDALLVPSSPHHTLQTLLDGIEADVLAITVVNFFANGQTRDYKNFLSVAGRFTQAFPFAGIHPLIMHRVTSTADKKILWSMIHEAADLEYKVVPSKNFCGETWRFGKSCFLGLMAFHYKTKSFDEYQLKCLRGNANDPNYGTSDRSIDEYMKKNWWLSRAAARRNPWVRVRRPFTHGGFSEEEFLVSKTTKQSIFSFRALFCVKHEKIANFFSMHPRPRPPTTPSCSHQTKNHVEFFPISSPLVAHQAPRSARYSQEDCGCERVRGQGFYF